MVNRIQLCALLFFNVLNLMSTPMKLSKEEQQTIDFYNKNAQTWAEKHGPDAKNSFWLQELAEFNELLPSGEIIEIGFGGAKEAGQLIRMGYAYTGIDAAAQLAKLAKARFAQATFLTQNLLELDLSNKRFDGFWCSAVLLHVSQDSIDRALQNIKKVLKPGAVGFISIAQGSGQHFDEATGRSFYLYDQKEFSHLLQKHGFIIEKVGIRSMKTTKPMIQNWLTFFVRA